jgi:energy-coupling factor transporter transmembrane protein EcfT
MKMALVRFVLSLFAFLLFYSIAVYVNRRDNADREKNAMECRAGRPWRAKPTYVKRHFWLCVVVCFFDFLSLIAVLASVIGIILALPIG